MDWTDLQENWAPLSDPDKFRKYARENHCVLTPSADGDSFFESDRGSFYDNIMEFDFTNIPNIEKEILRIAGLSGLNNTEPLARVSAVTMMKRQPKEVTSRERFKMWEVRHGQARPASDLPVGQPASAVNAIVEKRKEAKGEDGAPPDFYYPM
jgi:hypothetical protein